MIFNDYLTERSLYDFQIDATEELIGEIKNTLQELCIIKSSTCYFNYRHIKNKFMMQDFKSEIIVTPRKTKRKHQSGDRRVQMLHRSSLPNSVANPPIKTTTKVQSHKFSQNKGDEKTKIPPLSSIQILPLSHTLKLFQKANHYDRFSQLISHIHNRKLLLARLLYSSFTNNQINLSKNEYLYFIYHTFPSLFLFFIDKKSSFIAIHELISVLRIRPIIDLKTKFIFDFIRSFLYSNNSMQYFEKVMNSVPINSELFGRYEYASFENQLVRVLHWKRCVNYTCQILRAMIKYQPILPIQIRHFFAILANSKKQLNSEKYDQLTVTVIFDCFMCGYFEDFLIDSVENSGDMLNASHIKDICSTIRIAYSEYLINDNYRQFSDDIKQHVDFEPVRSLMNQFIDLFIQVSVLNFFKETTKFERSNSFSIENQFDDGVDSLESFNSTSDDNFSLSTDINPLRRTKSETSEKLMQMEADDGFEDDFLINLDDAIYDVNFLFTAYDIQLFYKVLSFSKNRLAPIKGVPNEFVSLIDRVGELKSNDKWTFFELKRWRLKGIPEIDTVKDDYYGLIDEIGLNIQMLSKCSFENDKDLIDRIEIINGRKLSDKSLFYLQNALQNLPLVIQQLKDAKTSILNINDSLSQSIVVLTQQLHCAKQSLNKESLRFIKSNAIDSILQSNKEFMLSFKSIMNQVTKNIPDIDMKIHIAKVMNNGLCDISKLLYTMDISNDYKKMILREIFKDIFNSIFSIIQQGQSFIEKIEEFEQRKKKLMHMEIQETADCQEMISLPSLNHSKIMTVFSKLFVIMFKNPVLLNDSNRLYAIVLQIIRHYSDKYLDLFILDEFADRYLIIKNIQENLFTIHERKALAVFQNAMLPFKMI